MTNTPAATPGTGVDVVTGFGDDLEPAVKRHLAAQHREARQLALTGVVPRSITHPRRKVGDKWQDVEVPVAEVVATLFAVVRYGELFGYPPAVALSKIDVIEGRLEPRYDALLGLLYDAGHQLRWGECTAESATARCRRKEDRDSPDADAWQTITFTIAEARAAGLVKEGGNWTKYPVDMLRSKVVKRVVRLVCPDVLITANPVALELVDGVSVASMVHDEQTARDNEVVDGEVT